MIIKRDDNKELIDHTNLYFIYDHDLEHDLVEVIHPKFKYGRVNHQISERPSRFCL